jgi:hypothetical protein
MTSLINLCVIDDYPFKIGPQVGGLETDLQSNKIPWMLTAQEVQKLCKNNTSWSYWTPLTQVQKEWAEFANSRDPASSFCVQVNQVFDPRRVAVNRTSESHLRAQSMAVFANATKGTFSGIESIGKRVVQSLFKFSDKISASVQALKRDVDFEAMSHIIGIHLRDMETEYKLGEGGFISWEFVSLGLKCAQKIEEELELPANDTGWLFLSDRMVNISSEIRAQFAPNKLMIVYDVQRPGVLKPGNTARARGPARMHANFYALRDVALLTEDKIRAIGRTDGGFARLAGLFGGKTVIDCGMPGNRKQSNMVKR